MIEGLFRAIDRKDANEFGSFLSEDCIFRFGNQASISGKQNVIPYVAGFFDSIQSLSHELTDRWNMEGAILCHGYVTYIRHNGSRLKVPFANVFKLTGSQVREYLIFVDTSALYAE
ncbi:MAG TPA: nuclear transport factor 2 family protein [Bacteroidota bacterium]|nr:nuclear transport factor 2 family protein [Bacteroidota bacterium]